MLKPHDHAAPRRRWFGLKRWSVVLVAAPFVLVALPFLSLRFDPLGLYTASAVVVSDVPLRHVRVWFFGRQHQPHTTFGDTGLEWQVLGLRVTSGPFGIAFAWTLEDGNRHELVRRLGRFTFGRGWLHTLVIGADGRPVAPRYRSEIDPARVTCNYRD